MRKLLLGMTLAATLALGSSGCYSGPWKLTRSFEDTTSNLYGSNAWIHGALLGDIVPAYPIAGFFMAVVDYVIMNPWYFWTHDAWSGRGTVYQHDVPTRGRIVSNAFRRSGKDIRLDSWR